MGNACLVVQCRLVKVPFADGVMLTTALKCFGIPRVSKHIRAAFFESKHEI
ncbi:hypothetical protein [Neisseria animalis]|uniref:hypothetical protein n=1 Tax=Neisseria animalis TaxID=492 RepID=UPI0013BEAB5A|nr:hypothetical protein [Neisseria animalis]